jgi:hypothetical protein
MLWSARRPLARWRARQSLGRAELHCGLRQQGRLEPDAAPGKGDEQIDQGAVDRLPVAAAARQLHAPGVAAEILGLAGEVHLQPGQVGFGCTGPAKPCGARKAGSGLSMLDAFLRAMTHGQITGAILEAHKPL